jgi:hypothetical protein
VHYLHIGDEPTMDTTTILLVGVVLVLLVIVGWLLAQRRRSDRLRTTFGPEYERTVDDAGDRRKAEAELEARQRRVAELQIRPLARDDRERYANAWKMIQARFVDEPADSIAEADRLIGEVMERRGYPVADFEQRVADISVDHPAVVEHYRAAHAIAARQDERAQDTEALRQAMVHYRALFVDLLEAGPGEFDAPIAAEEPVDEAPLSRRAS